MTYASMYDCFLIARWHLYLAKRNMHHSKLFGLCLFKKNEMIVVRFVQTNFLWMRLYRQWLQRSFSLRGQGKMPLERDPVRPHKRIWNLMGTGSEVRNISATLKQSRVGISSRRDRSSWERDSTLSSSWKLPGGSGLNLRGPWLNMIQK